MSHAQIKQLSKRRFMFSTLRKVEFSKNLNLRMKCNISPNLVVLFKTPFLLDVSVSVGELINIKSVKKKKKKKKSNVKSLMCGEDVAQRVRDGEGEGGRARSEAI